MAGWVGDSGGGVVLAVLSLSAAAWLSHICWAAAWVARVASVSGGGTACSGGGDEDEAALGYLKRQPFVAVQKIYS